MVSLRGHIGDRKSFFVVEGAKNISKSFMPQSKSMHGRGGHQTRSDLYEVRSIKMMMS